VKYAEGLGAKSLAELRAKPADVILKGGRGGGPVVDGWLIREGSEQGFRRGQTNRSASADRVETETNPSVVIRAMRSSSFSKHTSASAIWPATSLSYIPPVPTIRPANPPSMRGAMKWRS
jgi:hypothetical protein